MAFPSFQAITQDIFGYVVNLFNQIGIVGSVFLLIFLMVFQAVIAPIISEAILSGTGGAFYEAFGTPGIYAAIIGGIIGSLLGATTAFYISRWIQGQVKKRIADENSHEEEITGDTAWERMKSRFRVWLNKVSHFLARFIDEDSEDFIEIIEERGFVIVFVGRILPFVPFDAVSYGAGFTRIHFKDFIIATAFGSVPRVIFYVLVGAQLGKNLTTNFNAFLIIFGVAAGAILLLYKFAMSYVRKQNVATTKPESVEELEEYIESDE